MVGFCRTNEVVPQK